MEAYAQSPTAERSGGVGSGRTRRQTQSAQQGDDQQQNGKAEGEIQSKGNGTKSSSPSFGRLPRNVIERYVVGLFFSSAGKQDRNTSRRMCIFKTASLFRRVSFGLESGLTNSAASSTPLVQMPLHLWPY